MQTENILIKNINTMNKTIYTIIFLACLTAINGFGQINHVGLNNNMVAGDFNNDGKNNCIAGFSTTGNLPELIIWEPIAGNFTQQKANLKIMPGLTHAQAVNGKIVAGDFDNDNFIDDIAAIYEIGENKTSITVWLNNNGAFTPAQWWFGGDFDANQTKLTIVAGDFDNDGFIDDIAAFYNYEQKRTKVFVWAGNKNKFNWPGTWWVGNDFNSARVQGTIVAGDFDHDGFIDDIATLYDYTDGYCKIFVWAGQKNKFNWPYTWYKQDNFLAAKTKGNVVAGDFNHNGFVDNIATFYAINDNLSEILVFERNKNGFNTPQQWWVGNNEAMLAQNRLVAIDADNNGINNYVVGLTASNGQAQLLAWEAQNNYFNLPKNGWIGTTTNDNCNQNGKCISNNIISQLKMYPNPCRGAAFIDIPEISNNVADIAIYNVLGKKIFATQTTGNQTFQLNLNNISTGTYMVTLSANNLNLKQSLIVE